MPELVGYRLRRPEMKSLVLIALAVAAGLAAYFQLAPPSVIVFLWVLMVLLVIVAWFVRPRPRYRSPSTRGH